MPYSEEEIEKYLDILHKYTKPPEVEKNRKAKCWNCQRDDCFTIVSGFKICENCGCQNGHVLGYFDKKDQDRLLFRVFIRESIIMRKRLIK